MRRAVDDPLGGWVYVLLALAEDEIDDVVRLRSDSLEKALRARGRSPESIPRVAALIERARAAHAMQAHYPRLPARRAKANRPWVALGVALVLVLAALAITLGRGYALRSARSQAPSSVSVSSSSR
jgi:hypothetical protein